MLKMASYNNYDSYYTENPEPGDLIEVFRPGYQHWTLYLGDGYVINMAPTDEGRNGGIQKSHDSPQLAQEVNEDSSPVPFTSAKSVFSKKALVRMQLLKDVVGSDTYRINNKYDDMYSPLPLDEIIRLSEFLIGQEVSYDLLVNNCEHFVTLLRYGEGISEQANRAIGAIGIVTAAAGAFSLLGLFPSKQRNGPLGMRYKRNLLGNEDDVTKKVIQQSMARFDMSQLKQYIKSKTWKIFTEPSLVQPKNWPLTKNPLLCYPPSAWRPLLRGKPLPQRQLGPCRLRHCPPTPSPQATENMSNPSNIYTSGYQLLGRKFSWPDPESHILLG